MREKSTTISFWKNMRRLTVTLMCFCLLFGSFSPVFGAETGAEDVKMQFPDVSASHWAYPYITKLALQGIVLGDEKGRYNANQNVRQQDAIIMAINFMGLQDTAQLTDTSGVLPIEVDNYARPYVKLALDIGLLDAREELVSESDYADLSWGKRPATREWIAKITIRIIQQEAEAESLSNQPAPFIDNDQISAWALGYINRAVALNIVSGFDDDRFKPKDLVTRAQMAVFLSRSEPYLSQPLDRVFTGLVTEISGNRLKIQSEDGKTHEFLLDNKAAIYNSTDGIVYANRSDIETFYEIYVIAIESTAYYVEILDDEIDMEVFEGTLVAKDFESDNEKKITVIVSGDYLTFSLSPNVMITDLDGSGMNLSSLTEQSELILKRPAEAEKPDIVQITVKSIPINKSGEGEVVNVESDQMTINIGNTQETYPIAEDALLTHDNRILSGPQELNQGDRVSYQIDHGIFTRIRVIEPAVPYLTYDEGIIDDVNEDRVILLRLNQDIKGYFFANNVTVDLEGKSQATIKDLLDGDRVRLTLNQSNEVQHIQIYDREIERRIQVEIVYYDRETKSLMLRVDDKAELFELTSNTMIRTDSAKISLENFGNLFTNGKLVDIVYSKDRLIEIKLSSYYDGIINDLNRIERTLSIETELFDEIDVELENPIIIAPDQNSTSFDSLNIGDHVRISLSSNQDEISLIQLKKTLIYEMDSINYSTRFMSVTRDDGTSRNVFIPQQTPIIGVNGDSLTINKIPESGPIMISYVGTAIEKVYVPVFQQGRVTYLDAAANKIQVTDHQGVNRMFTLNKELKIRKDGILYDSLSESKLSIDDRIELAQDYEGNQYISVLDEIEKTFWKYDAKTQIVSFRRTNLSEDYQYKVDSNSFIHENWKTTSLSSFKDGDKVMVYIQGDRIIEMTTK